MNNRNKHIPLWKPARYFPINKGRYELKPGLHSLSTDFGNGKPDVRTFQIDTQFDEYIAVKQQCRIERLDKYFLTADLSRDAIIEINRFIIDTLARDYPECFDLFESGGQRSLYCRLTGRNINFSFKNTELNQQTELLDRLAMQIQEDLAIVELDEHCNDRLSALHLCFPNYWSAEEKIGKNFLTVHQPVPGMERINQQSCKILQAILHKGPFVRFAWGLTTDKRLNHHPISPSGVESQDWYGRAFDAGNPELYLRIERQTLHGFPQQMAILFTIRSSFMDLKEIRADNDKRLRIIDALSTMRDDSLTYKGLTQSQPDILNWLNQVER